MRLGPTPSPLAGWAATYLRHSSRLVDYGLAGTLEVHLCEPDMSVSTRSRPTSMFPLVRRTVSQCGSLQSMQSLLILRFHAVATHATRLMYLQACGRRGQPSLGSSCMLYESACRTTFGLCRHHGR